MKSNPEVSVIIPCHNYGRFLSEALDSVQNQSFDRWECIVIDNDSSDNTKQIAESFSLKDSRFRYIFERNRGVSKARNTGIQNSLGKYILPLDADDKIAKSYLEKALQILNNNNNIKILYCEAELFGEMDGKWNLPDFSWKEFLIENMIFVSCLFRKTDWQKAGGYDEHFREGLEDWDFHIRLLKEGGEVFRIPEILFYYRIHSTSRNSFVVKQLPLQKMIREQIYEKHKELYEQHFNLPDLLWEYILLRNKMLEISHELNHLKRTKAYRLYKKIF